MIADDELDEWLRGMQPAFGRGATYFKQGRVEEVTVSKDAIAGYVNGSERYFARIYIARDLDSSCTCPMGLDCKHVVAVGLAYLDARRGVPVSKPRAPAAAFESRKELEAFTKEHGISYVMPVAAAVLLGELRANEQVKSWLSHSLARLPLGEVGSRTGAMRYLGGGSEAVAVVAEAAQRYVHAQAADVAAAIVEEDHPRGLEPAESTQPLVEKLVAARRVLREASSPRSRATRALGSLAFDESGPTVVWVEPGHVWRPTTYTMAPITAMLSLPARKGELVGECTCGAPRCTHLLALVDTMLDRLHQPGATLEVFTPRGRTKAPVTVPIADVATALLRPGWARALAELDRFSEPVAKPAAQVEVWWEIEEALGTVQLRPLVKKQLKSGKLSAGAKISAHALLDDHRETMSEPDRRVAEALAAWDPDQRAGGTYPVQALLLLVGHPRVICDDEPVTIVRMSLGFSLRDATGGVRIEPAIDGEPFDARLLTATLELHPKGEPLAIFEPEAQRFLLVDASDEARRLWSVLQQHGDTFPPEAHEGLLERLGKLEARMPITVPPTLKGKQLAPEVSVVVRLRLLPDVSLEVELFVRPAPGAPLFHPGAGPKEVMVMHLGERAYVKRDLHAEAGIARAAIAPLPMTEAVEGPPDCFRFADPEDALKLVAACQDEPPGLEVEWIDGRVTVTRSVGPEALRVTVDRKRDWFGIVGELRTESGRLELAQVLDAARRQQRFVRVDENRFVELSEALRQRLLAVSDQVYPAKGRLELSPGAAPALRDLEAAGAAVKASSEWETLAARLATATTLKPKPPAALAATLRDYQIEGHAWLTRVAAWGAGAVLADDMGLGKTLQAIAVLLDRAKQGPALVIAPTSVAYNWVAELERFAPNLRPVLYGEQSDRAEAMRKLRKSDVMILSYGLLVRDAELLAGTKFATLILDEAQALKNPSTRRARAARGLDATFRIGLSGTPFENHLGELWSLLAVVFPGLLGSWDQFRDRYAVPIEKGKDPVAQAALSRVLRPFLLRRTKGEVARELPARTEIAVPVALSTEEHSLYEDARLAAVAELSDTSRHLRDEQKRFQVLAALTRLRLLASHPKLYDPRSTIASSKLRRALELLEELRSEGHRALVFSQFTSHLGLVRDAMDAAGFKTLYLDGSTPAKERAKLVAAFQAGEGDAFLISLKAGGTGINLTAADYVLHMDPWWNPAVEDQATDRAHRIGQSRPVTVYRLIARGTIEEQILAMHGDKRALVAGVLEGSNAAARLTAKDLFSLLAGSDAAPADPVDEDQATVH